MITGNPKFDDSYWRVMSEVKDGRDFIDAFYDRFFAASDEVAPHFHGKDLDQLKRKLRLSLLFMTSFSSSQSVSPALEKIAMRHGPDYEDIPQHLFDVWEEALIDTVREYDPECDDEILSRWRSMLEPGIQYMKGHCRIAA